MPIQLSQNDILVRAVLEGSGKLETLVIHKEDYVDITPGAQVRMREGPRNALWFTVLVKAIDHGTPKTLHGVLLTQRLPASGYPTTDE